jgi:hypothetical protein
MNATGLPWTLDFATTTATLASAGGKGMNPAALVIGINAYVWIGHMALTAHPAVCYLLSCSFPSSVVFISATILRQASFHACILFF